uniref:Salivary OBP/D7 family protein n=1 Tax=Simulium nigrimanum TaxID=683695 RepID=D1FPT1_SIMNI
MKVIILLIAFLVAVGAEVATLVDQNVVEFICEKDVENKHGPGCLLSCDVLFWDTSNENNKEYEDKYKLCKVSASDETTPCAQNEELRSCFLHGEAFTEVSDEYEETYSLKSK